MKNRSIFISPLCVFFFLIFSCQDANPKTTKEQSDNKNQSKENVTSKNEVQSERLNEKKDTNQAFVHNFSGNYFGNLNGTEISMQLLSNGTTVYGTLIMNGEQAQISATSNNTTFEGKIIEDISQKTYVVSAQWKQEKLHFSITFPEFGNKVVEMILQKGKKEANASSNRNQMLVGTWRYTEVMSSGSGSNYMSFSTDYFVKFNADGSFSSWTGKSAGGSQNTSIESGASNAVNNLKWHTSGKQIVLSNPSNGKSESMTYYVETNRMMLSTNKNKRVFQRVN